MIIIFETFSHDVAVKVKDKLEKEYPDYAFDIKGSLEYTCITLSEKILSVPVETLGNMRSFCRGASSMIS